MLNENPKNQGVRFVGPVPMVPLIILVIWLILTVVYYTVGLPHKVSLPIVLGTILWFVIWLIRAARRG